MANANKTVDKKNKIIPPEKEKGDTKSKVEPILKKGDTTLENGNVIPEAGSADDKKDASSNEDTSGNDTTKTSEVTTPDNSGSKGSVDVDNTIKNTPMKLSDIEGLLKNNDITFEDKLSEILERGLPEFKMLVARLKSYANIMSTTSVTVNAIEGAHKNYDLYTLIKSVASVDNYDRFKLQFDIINLMFINYSNDAFDSLMLQRFDYAWKNGDKALLAYTNLVFIISELASIATRKENLNDGMLELALDRKKTNLPAIAVENITKYYS